MSNTFNLEIISPDQILLKSEVKEVIIPAFEGYITLLKDHVSLITFLRPGFISVEMDNSNEKFFVEDGTVEFFDNKLLILSSSSYILKKMSKEKVSEMIEETKVHLNNNELNDKEKYILNYKISSLQEINL
jgi:ATP synthase F1 epsilon subunit